MAGAGASRWNARLARWRAGRRRAPAKWLGLLLLVQVSVLFVLGGSSARAAHINPGVIATIPVSGAGAAVDDTRNLLYVSDGVSSVSVIDGTTNTVDATVPIGQPSTGCPDGCFIGDLAVNPATNRVYATVSNARCCAEALLVVIDGATRTVLRNIQLAETVVGTVAVNPATNRVYVYGWSPGLVDPLVNPAGSGLFVIDGSTNQVVDLIAVPHCGTTVTVPMQVNPLTNRLYLSDQGCAAAPFVDFEPSLVVIDGNTNTVVTTIPLDQNFPFDVAVDSGTAERPANRVFVSSTPGSPPLRPTRISVVDGATNLVTGTFEEGVADRVAFNPNTNRLYASWFAPQFAGLAVINADTGAIQRTFIASAAPEVNPATDTVYLIGGRIDVVGDVEPAADLALAKLDAPDPVRVGEPLTYTLRVTNNGPAEATGVTLTDTLPAGVSFGSPDPDQGSCIESDGTVRCELGSLASGAITDVRIVVTPTVAGTPTNTATVTAEQHDPNENDNTAQQATTVELGPFDNGSFEVPMIEDAERFRTIPAGKTIGPWVVTEGNVDIQSTWATPKDGRQSLDMAGTKAGSICQRFVTTPSATYDVSFLMSHNAASGRTSASLAVIVDGVRFGPFTHDTPSHNTEDPQWEPHVFSFTATGGSSELCFESTDPPVDDTPADAGAMLDNVTILSEPDTTAPTVSLATPAVAGTTGDATPTFSGAAGDAPGDSATITVKIYSGSDTSGPLVQTLTTTRSGSIWSVEGSSPLAPGTYTVQAEQSDAAGNVGLSSPSTFTVGDVPGDGGGGGGGALGGVAGAAAGAGQPPGPPTAGKTFNVEPVSGVVTFKCGSGPQRPLEEAEQLPIGCRIDSRRGKLRVISAAGKGKTQSAVFSGGVFTVRQKAGPKPVTELRLVGKLENCPAAGSASTAARARAKPGRRLWGSGKGAFRTRGRRSAATVTGTRWLVEDRCDGSTLTKVFLGRVKVRDFVLGKTITLTRGESYVARPRSRGRP